MANKFIYWKYTMILNNNNDLHNNTRCITISCYRPIDQDLNIAIDDHAPQKVYKYLNKADEVIDQCSRDK